MKRLLPAALTVSGIAASVALSGPEIRPDKDAVFTSTRCVSTLARTDEGLWVGTPGGVLLQTAEGGWRKFTRLDGLPSHEVRGFRAAGRSLLALFPKTAARWENGSWRPAPEAAEPEPAPGVTCSTVWRGEPCLGTAAGLRFRRESGWKEAPLPASQGTHPGALLARGDRLLVGVYGDGLWEFDGEIWSRALVQPPEMAREITALLEDGEALWLGTRRAGLWRWDGRAWSQRLEPDEPADHNCQALAVHAGSLYASTLEDGLAVRSPGEWRHAAAGELSSAAPRQMVTFRGALYLRHGGGRVDRLRDGRWERHVFADLPRKEVSALAAGGDRLFVGQWGGWSEFDGMRWTHRLKIPELQGAPVTALLRGEETLWVGTQGRGVLEVDLSTGRVHAHDERAGLTDDWITVLARVGEREYAGTFVGGLAYRVGAVWRPVPELTGENVTALEPDGRGGLYVATRTGLWRLDPNQRVTRVEADFLDLELQALCAEGEGLWVGARTGIFFLRRPGSSS